MSENWKEALLRQGKIKRMCADNLTALRLCETREQSITLYKKTIDWALENNYPPLSVIREDFHDCEDMGIFVDKKLDITISKLQVYVFHNCKGIINVEMDYEGCNIPMLYFANGCDVKVTCKQKNRHAIRVPLYIFGENKIRIADTPNADFAEYRLPILED